MENKLSNISNVVLNHYYSHIPYDCDDDFQLILLSKADKSCYNDKQLQCYKELVNRLTFDCSVSRKPVLVDDSFRENWERSNPNCVSRKLWERIAYKICKDYGLDIVVEKVIEDCPIPNINITKLDIECNISMEIVKNIIPCDVITSISIQKLACNENFEISRSLDECNVDYKLLSKKFLDFNLSKKDYFYLVDNKFTYDCLDTIYSNNLSLYIKDQSIYLKSPYNTYDISTLEAKKIVAKAYSGPKLVIQLLKDYTINNIKKQTILNGTIYI